MLLTSRTINDKQFNAVVIIAYGLLLAVLMFHHELWRDETQAWLIAKASHTPLDIFSNNKYEGHPPIWIFIVWPFAHLFDNPEWIKVPHWLLAVTTASLILRYAPFPRWATVMLLFGYFFWYEYATISRNYQIGVLGIIAFLSFYDRALHKPWIGLFCLSLAIWANIYAMMLASVLSLYFLIDLVEQIRKPNTTGAYKRQVLICSSIFVTLLLCMVIVTKPPADGSFIQWNFRFNGPLLEGTFNSYFRTLLPISQNEMAYWNNSLFWGSWLPYAGGALMILVVASFWKYPKYLFWLALIMLALSSFQYFKYIGFLRHSGHHWLALIVVIWLLAKQVGWSHIYIPIRALFSVLLVVHFVSGVMAASKEIRYTFSGGKAASSFIKEQQWENRTIIAHTDYSVSSLSAFLGKPLYYTMIGDSGTFVKWTIDRKNDNIHTFLQSKQAELLNAAAGYIIVTSFPVADNYPWIQQVFDTGETVVWDEHLYVNIIVAPINP